jgi:hypothetical protein
LLQFWALKVNINHITICLSVEKYIQNKKNVVIQKMWPFKNGLLGIACKTADQKTLQIFFEEI